MKNADRLKPSEARELVKEEYNISVSKETMHLWCKKHHIGIKIVGRWYVNKKRLKWLLEGMEWKITKEQEKENLK